MDPKMLHYCCKQLPSLLSDEQIEQDHSAMRDCLALVSGVHSDDQDVPIAAKIWHPDLGWVAQAVNTSRLVHDATAHAEINVIRQACVSMQNYRLPGCTLYVTLEPCIMCFSAMMEARISRIVFAASDRKLGVLSKGMYRSLHAFSNHHFSWTGGVCADDASAGLVRFFRAVCRS